MIGQLSRAGAQKNVRKGCHNMVVGETAETDWVGWWQEGGGRGEIEDKGEREIHSILARI